MIKYAHVREIDEGVEVVGISGEPPDETFRVLSSWKTADEAISILELNGWSRVWSSGKSTGLVGPRLWCPPVMGPSLGSLPGVPTACVPVSFLEACPFPVHSVHIPEVNHTYDIFPEIVEVLDRRYGAMFGFTYGVSSLMDMSSSLGYGPVLNAVSQRVGVGIRAIGIWFRPEDAQTAAYKYFDNLIRRDTDGSFYAEVRAYIHRNALSDADPGG